METNKNILDDIKQDEDENFLSALVVLVGLLALFFIISYWPNIALYISPAFTWLNSVALPSTIAFLSTGIGITLTAITVALIAAGVITYVANITPLHLKNVNSNKEGIVKTENIIRSGESDEKIKKQTGKNHTQEPIKDLGLDY
jgi:hypothetical protein